MMENSTLIIKLESPSTFLSTKVHRIICEIGSTTSKVANTGQDTCVWLTKEGVLQWKPIQSMIDRVTIATEIFTYDYYVHLSEALAPLLLEIEHSIASLTSEEFFTLHEARLQWTIKPEVVLRCHNILTNDVSGAEVIHSLLLSTAILERSLGDVYLHYCEESEKCPSMLKDLLEVVRRKEIFEDSVVRILEWMMGPPISLNLRNVVWHGFPTPGEIPKRYGYLMLAVIVSLGQSLSDNNISFEDIKHRPFIDFPHTALLNTVMPSKDWVILKTLAAQSAFVAPKMEYLLSEAVDAHLNQQYGEVVSLILPQLEHGLRRIFAAVNDCPQRVLTAENTTLFTTFDEILKQYVRDEEENKLRELLGDTLLERILDLLVYPDGPRVRDRVSHGECDVTIFPAILAEQFLLVAAALCLRFLEPHSVLHKNQILLKIKECFKVCQVTFHPLVVLRGQIVDAFSSLSNWSKIPMPREEERPENDGEGLVVPDQSTLREENIYEAAVQMAPLCHVKHEELTTYIQPFGDMSPVLAALTEKKLKTLYRWPDIGEKEARHKNREPELVSLLSRIVHQTSLIATQIVDVMSAKFGQWERKELRSRQRHTYQRVMSSVPYLACGLKLVLLNVIGEVCSMESEHADSLLLTDTKFRFPLKLLSVNDCYMVFGCVAGVWKHSLRWLKFVLQYCENLLTYTRVEKNRWDRAVTFTDELVVRMTQL